MLSKDLENSLNQLFKDCSENHEEFVTIEHLLLVLTQEESSRKVFESLSVDITSLQKEIKDHIKKNVPKVNEKKKFNPRWLSKEFFKELFFMSNPVEKLKFMERIFLLPCFQKKKATLSTY